VNQLSLTGKLVERSALRFTPAGIPVVEAQFEHCSELVEGGMLRKLAFTFDAVLIGDLARTLGNEGLGGEMALRGFVAPRSRRSTRLQVHVTEFTRLEVPAAPAGSSRNDENS